MLMRISPQQHASACAQALQHSTACGCSITCIKAKPVHTTSVHGRKTYVRKPQALESRTEQPTCTTASPVQDGDGRVLFRQSHLQLWVVIQLV